MSVPLLERGWVTFPYDADIAQWAEAAREVAVRLVRAPEEQKWLRCGGTWFVGVDTLPNDAVGRVGNSGSFGGAALEAATVLYGALPLHRGQVSVVYPGYP
ncbi:MAG: hypothetical protein AAGF50_15050, partial [Pseudomonadota bacterium]